MAKVTRHGGASDLTQYPAEIDSEPLAEETPTEIPEDSEKGSPVSSAGKATPKTVSGKAGVKLPGLKAGTTNV